MMGRVAREAQIFGINFWIVSAAVAAATIAFSRLAGELLDFYPAIFEVVYPFFAAIVVGEWGKTRSDGNFDLIAAQCESLFPWVLRRYTAAFGGASLFAVLSMTGASIARYELPLGELLAIYFPPAFFLSPCARYWDSCASRNTLPPWLWGCVAGPSFHAKPAKISRTGIYLLVYPVCRRSEQHLAVEQGDRLFGRFAPMERHILGVQKNGLKDTCVNSAHNGYGPPHREVRRPMDWETEKSGMAYSSSDTNSAMRRMPSAMFSREMA